MATLVRGVPGPPAGSSAPDTGIEAGERQKAALTNEFKFIQFYSAVSWPTEAVHPVTSGVLSPYNKRNLPPRCYAASEGKKISLRRGSGPLIPRRAFPLKTELALSPTPRLSESGTSYASVRKAARSHFGTSTLRSPPHLNLYVNVP